jgi:hypothetical protein
MKKIFPALVLLLFFFFFAVGTAAAASTTVLGFDINFPPTVGSISYTSGSPLIGGNIKVDSVTGNNGHTLDIQGGYLNFETGPFDGFYNTVVGPVWHFTGGGSLTINGKIPLLGINDPVDLVYDGLFESVSVIGTGALFKFLISQFTDKKNELLAGYFGVPEEGWSGMMNISFMAAQGQDDSWYSTMIISGNVVNSVPVPAPLLLLGSGLAGLLAMGRKKVFSK